MGKNVFAPFQMRSTIFGPFDKNLAAPLLWMKLMVLFPIPAVMAPSLSTIYSAVMLCRNYRTRQHNTAPQDSSTDQLDIRCIYCTSLERLLTFKQLKRGDHVCMGGANFQSNVGVKQVHAYTHHAIVKHVEFINEAAANLTMIHFTTTLHDKNIKIQETTERKNIDIHEMYVVKYRHRAREIDDIIQRAETLVNQDIVYSLLECNCETFAHWCVTGQEESYQATSCVTFLNDILRNCDIPVMSAKIRRIIHILMITVNDEAEILSNLAGPIVFAVFATLYGLYCKSKIKKLSIRCSRGEICKSCFGDQRFDIWIRYGAFVSTQLMNLLAIPVRESGSTAIVAVCSVLSLGMIWGLPRLRRAIRTPFRGKKIDIYRLNQILVGDVVSFSYNGMMHDCIVCSINGLSEASSERGKIKIIHYALPGILISREIREDELSIDLNTTYLKRHDYSGYDTHAPEEVVARARMRIGETKFGILSNRSCHLCHWAKTKEPDAMAAKMQYQEQSIDFSRSLDANESVANAVYADHRRYASHATKTLPTKLVIVRDDLTKGQLVQFKYGHHWHKAICTDVKPGDHPSMLVVTLVHYSRTYTVTEEEIVFDLRREDIYLYDFHPLCRYNQNDVIRQARVMVGEQKYSLFSMRSSHMAEEAICKDKDMLVGRLDELQKGDVIIFKYWSLMHEAVVSDVIIDDSKTNGIGQIWIIHYALKRWFSTREIIEEDIYVNLQQETIYKKSFHLYTTYPSDMVVKRARSRVGERKFHCKYNTSFDFVHWTKVIQKPCVVKMTPVDEAGNVDVETGREIVLLPQVGATFGLFRVDWIKTWNELTPGHIIEYRYYMLWHTGIVSRVDPKRNEVDVIHYGTSNVFATRTILAETIHIDLKVDKIWVYICDSAKCHPVDIIVQKAKARLGEQDWKRGNRSWDFCKACTLK